VHFSVRRSLLDTESTLASAAVLAAHGVTRSASGFSATDVRFYFRLFANFIERDLTRPGQDLALVQVRRALLQLVARHGARAAGRAKTLRGKAGATWVLTARGVVDLLRHLAHDAPRRSFEEAVLAAVFVASYEPFLLASLPPDETHEATALCDAPAIVERALAHARRLEADLQERARTGGEMADEARVLLAVTRDVTTRRRAPGSAGFLSATRCATSR